MQKKTQRTQNSPSIREPQRKSGELNVIKKCRKKNTKNTNSPSIREPQRESGELNVIKDVEKNIKHKKQSQYVKNEM